MTRRGKAVLSGLAMVLGGSSILGIVLYSSLSHFGTLRLAQATEAWEATFEPWDAVIARYPSRGPNDVARATERLAAEVEAGEQGVG